MKKKVKNFTNTGKQVNVGIATNVLGQENYIVWMTKPSDAQSGSPMNE